MGHNNYLSIGEITFYWIPQYILTLIIQMIVIFLPHTIKLTQLRFLLIPVQTLNFGNYNTQL